ncbi:ABC transporter ATP-binding protein [Methylobacterium sp. J-090]|uniref:ABC transporter ATP-binding protein n=1 Tax=Methylobacterium sp. J-090 TaxID=2836666 RepID=UPI001FBB6D2C|nr:ABC transporter ATP-binding protein [Methylobacterium sp. J-090]MCJ2082544.1 ABC transporter ATP-binding protein [Methylobacterium sp. J-090]
MPPDSPLVVVRGATLSYRDRRVLDGVDLDLFAGQTLALLGPNGAGKTSLMRLVAGRLAPQAGHVRIAGCDPFAAPEARRAIGWVPQDIALYPRLTVAENLDVFARLAGLGRHARRAAVADALDQTDIAAVAGRPVGLLSGGYQRRVNIAASLMAQPRLVLLDEPTQGVDLHARAAIHAVLERLRRAGAAVLVATHDFAEAERLADRAAFLAEGRIVREGTLPDLLARRRDGAPEHEVALSGPASGPAEAALRRAGFAPVDTGLTWRALPAAGPRLNAAALLDALRAEGVPVAEIRIRTPGLEAVYRDALGLWDPADPVRLRRREGAAS